MRQKCLVYLIFLWIFERPKMVFVQLLLNSTISLCFSKLIFYQPKYLRIIRTKIYIFFHILLFRSFSQNTERSPETTSTSMSLADQRYADRLKDNCIFIKAVLYQLEWVQLLIEKRFCISNLFWNQDMWDIRLARVHLGLEVIPRTIL